MRDEAAENGDGSRRMAQFSSTLNVDTYVDRLAPGPECSSPRAQMAARLPSQLQPFLTWITAQPAPGEAAVQRSPLTFVLDAVARTGIGIALSCTPWMMDIGMAWLLIPLGWLITSSGLGLFQVVVFHHCAHGTVFATRELNRRVGRLISAVLLFKHFDDYRREHMGHHSARKLLTDEDEFADFVLGLCGLRPGEEKRILWLKVIAALLSPRFHLKFAQRRVRSSLASRELAQNALGISALVLPAGLAASLGWATPYLVAWLVPLTVLLQIATVLRILCEHRFPPPEIIATRDKAFVCHATAGVFAGRALPEGNGASSAGMLEWLGWWIEMLTVHLFTRVFVLVGDAPCHDFHHRHPASRKWTGYIHARQQDKDRGCPGFPADYIDSWGLFRAIDESLASLAATRREWL